MEKHAFLSPEWIDAALAIRDEYASHLPEPPAPVRMNLLITDAPDGGDDIHASIDTGASGLLPRLGHMDAPELTVRMDFETARTLMMDQDLEAVAGAFFAGKIAVDGDITKLFFLQTLEPTEDQKQTAADVHRRVMEMTS